jgi:hypothetical protein
VVWAFGTAFTIYYAGHAAERYLQDFSWVALAVAIVAGLGTTYYLRRRAARADALLGDADPATSPTAPAEVAAIVVHAAADPPVAVITSARTAVSRATHRRKPTRRSWRTRP